MYVMYVVTVGNDVYTILMGGTFISLTRPPLHLWQVGVVITVWVFLIVADSVVSVASHQRKWFKNCGSLVP